MSNKPINLIDEDLFETSLAFAKKIFPYHKSVTGEGIDNAFKDLKEEIGCDVHEFKTGTEILGWQVPKSWKCSSLSIKNLDNGDIIATLDHPLRVASHSDAVKKKMIGAELKKNIALSAKVPDSLSHQYIYYSDGWRISLTEKEFAKIDDSSFYFVDLQSEVYDGSLKVAELIKKGSSPLEMFFLSHICHPAQFNDGLVGVMANVYLSKWIDRNIEDNFFTYKFLSLPETIGSHAYCSLDGVYKNGVMALFTEMTALDSPLHIQMSENESDLINIYLRLAAVSTNYESKFSPFLSVIRNDEKVFGAPGIELPSASVTRALGRDYENHPYLNYHTSEDTIENANIEMLKEALIYLQHFIQIMELDRVVHRNFTGIPMLSRNNLFFNPDTHREMYDLQEQLVWQLKKPKSISKIAVDLDSNFFDILDLLTKWEEQKLVKFYDISHEFNH